MPIIYLAWRAKRAHFAAESWHAKGLEWEQSPTPPPTLNFIEPPIVTEEAYNYAEECLLADTESHPS